MPIEIEAKMKVDDFEPIRELLIRRSATPLGHYLETNILFDLPDRALLSAGKALRLRRRFDLRLRDELITLTCKGPPAPGPLKQRQEIELTVDHADAATALLRELGFTPTLTFEKKRQSWRLNDCTIELDELPRLGRFVEIEAASGDAVLEARKTLSLHQLPLISEPYPSLVASHLQEHRLPGDTLLFDNHSPDTADT